MQCPGPLANPANCVGAGKNILMSIFDRLGSHFFRRKMEKAQPKRENWMERSLIPPESAFFVSLVHMIKILFPSCTLIWIVNINVPRRGKSMFKWNKITFTKIIFLNCKTLYKLPWILFVRLDWL